MVVRSLLILILVLGISAPASGKDADVRRVRIGKKFSYDLFVPKSYDESKSWPLLTLYHWSTGRSTNMLRVWKEAADRYGIVLAVPNSRWTMRWTKRDLENTQTMIVDVTAELNIDPNRIYASGFSSGAKFVYTLMAHNPGLFRAIGPFGGRMVATEEQLGHRLSRNETRVCIFHGRSDRRVRVKHANKALLRLRSHGYDVHMKTYGSGHWLPKEHVHAMWRCLDGARPASDS